MGELLVGVLLGTIVLVGIPTGNGVDNVGDGIKVCQRHGGLRLVWRQEVRCKVPECLDELHHGPLDSVVCVVGRRAIAKGKGVLEGGLVVVEDGEGGLDTRSWCLGDDFVCNGGVLVADVLQEISHIVGRQRLQQARQVEWPTGRSGGACAFDGTMGKWLGVWEVAVGCGRRSSGRG